jgi:hypothetical protein
MTPMIKLGIQKRKVLQRTIETKQFMGGSFQIRRIDAKTNDYARLHPWYPNESPWSPVRRAPRKWS